MILLQELHAGSQVSTQSVLERDSEDDDTSPVVTCEIDTLRNLTSRDRKEDSASAIVARLLVVLESKHSLQVVFSLNED
jgi:hypothetical protein